MFATCGVTVSQLPPVPRAVRRGSLGAGHPPCGGVRLARATPRKTASQNGLDDVYCKVFLFLCISGDQSRRWCVASLASDRMPPSRRANVDPSATVYKLQGGTGKHVDGDITEPLQGRPFQARERPRECRLAPRPRLRQVVTPLRLPLPTLQRPCPPQAFVQVSAAPADGSAGEGSLHVLPGFHSAAVHYFNLTDRPKPAGGFTPLTEHEHPGLCSPDTWVPVTRLPAEWVEMDRAGETPPYSSAPGARSLDGVLKALRGLAKELRGMSFSPPEPGDYVLWDPRLPHSTGERDALSQQDRPRQVFYCAYTLAANSHAALIHQRNCRETGLHPSWAPSAQARKEQGRDYVAAPLTPLGRSLYGYSDGTKARGERVDKAPGRRCATGGSCGGAGELAELLTPAHIRFYQRYGFVVVEGAVPLAHTEALGTELKAHLWQHHEIDLDDLHQTLTLKRLSAAFSPDGSGMVEMYWLPAMEAVRQHPPLHEITQQLFAATWGAGTRGFRLEKRAVALTARPTLGLYIDRTSLRLPASAIGHLVKSRRTTGYKIRVPVPLGYRLGAAGGEAQLLPGEYAVGSLRAVRRVAGRRQYLVEWEGYPGADTWEPVENIDPSLVAEFEARRAAGSGSVAADPPAPARAAVSLSVGRGGLVSVRLSALTPRKRKTASTGRGKARRVGGGDVPSRCGRCAGCLSRDLGACLRCPASHKSDGGDSGEQARVARHGLNLSTLAPNGTGSAGPACAAQPADGGVSPALRLGEVKLPAPDSDASGAARGLVEEQIVAQEAHLRARQAQHAHQMQLHSHQQLQAHHLQALHLQAHHLQAQSFHAQSLMAAQQMQEAHAQHVHAPQWAAHQMQPHPVRAHPVLARPVQAQLASQQPMQAQPQVHAQPMPQYGTAACYSCGPCAVSATPAEAYGPVAMSGGWPMDGVSQQVAAGYPPGTLFHPQPLLTPVHYQGHPQTAQMYESVYPAHLRTVHRPQPHNPSTQPMQHQAIYWG